MTVTRPRSPLRGLPLAEQTLPRLLQRQAEAHGNRVLGRAADGRERSFEGMRDYAASFAGTLEDAGVDPGDRVAIFANSKLEIAELWMACAWRGAIAVPINASLRGPQLEHELDNSGAKLLVADEPMVAHLDYLTGDLPALERVWTLGEGRGAWRGREIAQLPDPRAPIAPHDADPGDTAIILYTSGTTGPSKGVMCPHAQWYWWAVNVSEGLGVREDDVLHTTLPLFHNNPLVAFLGALFSGGTLVVAERFSASRFWDRLVESGATVTYLLGAMVTMVAAQPPGENDRAHNARIALAPATPAELHEPFRERFGLELIDGYGSTETNMLISSYPGEVRPGYMGHAWEGFELRVVDDEDQEVPDGKPGELIARHSEPFSFATGYWQLPEKTVETWRNLWFHSGDRVVREEDGYYRFLDRIKDAIRRRGENISAWEVERVLQSHPAVVTAAVVAVPSELAEDEVMACVVVREGAEVAAEDLMAHCEPRLAYFAIPRYVEFLPELPLTGSGKVAKYRLREGGVTDSTWDREAAGYTLKR